MAGIVRNRLERALEAARGYLTLEMPGHALRELDAITDSRGAAFEILLLRGESLRNLNRFEEALVEYGKARQFEPEDITLLMGMAWCYKRTGSLSRSIEAMELAHQAAPEEAIILYNLACYHSLAGDKARALQWLGLAIRKQGGLRKLIADESDFDSLRDDKDFQFVIGQSENPKRTV